MSFIGEHAGVIFNIVSIKLHIGDNMGSGHYVYDVLDYNTVTW